jgi:uncharacterized membrane protein YfcA
VHELFVFGAGIVAGAINSVAGGGTLVSFPTLIWLGVPSITANATNTVALWPGSLGGMWGYRREMRGVDRRAYTLVVPSIVGGVAGAVLLHRTPTDVFDRLVPILILFATILFMVQEPLQRRFNIALSHPRTLAPSHPSIWLSWALLFQLLVGIYGGYFGAGIGILMLAALGLMGHSDIHQMNGVKNMLALCINGVAAVYLSVAGLVSWPDTVVMAGGAMIGGVAGAGMARRIGRTAVRRVVVGIGFAMALSLMLRL